MDTPKTPPDVIWICRECWTRRPDNETTSPPIPTFIGECAECGEKDVPIIYVKVVSSSRHGYKGRSIRLTPDQQDGHWGCRVLVIELGNTHTPSPKGYVDGRLSSEEAELAALNAAQQIIDSIVSHPCPAATYLALLRNEPKDH